MFKRPSGSIVCCLFLLSAFASLGWARTPLGTSVFQIPVAFEDCKDRVAKAMSAEGFASGEPFGNGFQGYKGETSASIGCFDNGTRSLVMIVVSGDDNAGARIRLTELIRNPKASPPPTPTVLPTGGRKINWNTTGYELRNGTVRTEGSNQPKYKDNDRVLVNCPRWDNAPHGIWGTETYHEDSSICWSGVHAGLVMREGGLLSVQLGATAAPYRGSDRNGVRSNDYSANVRGSFKLAAVAGGATTVDIDAPKPPTHGPPLSGGRRIDWWTQGGQLRDGAAPNGGSNQPKYRIGERVLVTCSGQAYFPGGGLWGTDVYTLASTICAAGIHAGLVTLQQGGAFYVEFRPDAGSYRGTDRNGIRSVDLGRPFAAGAFRVYR